MSSIASSASASARAAAALTVASSSGPARARLHEAALNAFGASPVTPMLTSSQAPPMILI